MKCPHLSLTSVQPQKIYAVDEHGGYHGGTIAPGVEISMKALSGQASLLPSFSLASPPHACATNTIECLQSGIIFGTADMIDGMLDRLQNSSVSRKPLLQQVGFPPM